MPSIRPPVSGRSRGDLGDRGDLRLGSWNLGSGEHPGRAIWESNLGIAKLKSKMWRAPWESKNKRAVWGLALGSLILRGPYGDEFVPPIFIDFAPTKSSRKNPTPAGLGGQAGQVKDVWAVKVWVCAVEVRSKRFGS